MKNLIKLTLLGVIALIGCSSEGIENTDTLEQELRSPCEVTYAITRTDNNYTALVQLKNSGPNPVSGWSLTWTRPAGQTITSWSSVNISQSGVDVTGTNKPSNAYIAPGASRLFSVRGTTSNIDKPSIFWLNGIFCRVYI